MIASPAPRALRLAPPANDTTAPSADAAHWRTRLAWELTSTFGDCASPAALFDDMDRLADLNPTAFRALAAQLALTFHEAADCARGPARGFLVDVARTFRAAAMTGALAPLEGPFSTEMTRWWQDTLGVASAA
jgi:hypothetical protein